ncbi:MAG: hypothetical protein DLM67_06535 [Candidatus Nephthysia bennettiae]|uniref:Uncharacterized protein n=1 Tax=Candidatus Nephthysia bennettiae TaxID=3127016 RepID=A0A934N7M3_9BACT|nr:hypothetical protein [Candidatus Dormibacteraeota bacterium]MBJ7614755.1 hypothetical protein [Candidatus Dormibacteraeota bacterium]PZR98059.1 MAG: hypothetical protein DLM67_06535 [Candidatus Dormibacteraeota bacterium]
MAESRGELEDLTRLPAEELAGRVAQARARMRPLETQLAEMRAQRDVLLTEQRRRERLAHRNKRAGVKEGMRGGQFPTFSQLLGGTESGAFDRYHYHLKTGGEVRLGFPGARKQTVSFTDGRRLLQAQDFAEAVQLYMAGWELGSPGRPGLRVHFPGTRQERLADPEEVFARSDAAEK